MTDNVTIDDSQLQKLLASIHALQNHAPFWNHFLITAAPIFLASLLGLATALLLDWLKNRRENRKSIRERLEKELAQLSGANTAIAFNIEALIHSVMQQILPHHKQSHAACTAIEALNGDSNRLQQINDLLHSEFRPMLTRCPEPYLEDVNLSKDLPFLIAKDPGLIKLSGWIITYTRNLKAILNDRNKLIDITTIENAKDGLDLPDLERQIATQATIADVEVVNAYQLFLLLKEASKKIENIITSEYKGVVGPKLKVELPEVFGNVMTDLESIAIGVVPDWPPPEPPATKRF